MGNEGVPIQEETRVQATLRNLDDSIESLNAVLPVLKRKMEIILIPEMPTAEEKSGRIVMMDKPNPNAIQNQLPSAVKFLN